MKLDAHILQVIPRLDVGGAERTTVDVSRAVIEAGGRSSVACDGGRLARDVARDGGTVIELPLRAKNPAQLWRNRGRLAALIRERGVDLVHARSRAPAWSALWAARATDTPFVTTYHGAYSATTPWKRFYNSVMARGDVVIANSVFIRDHIYRTHRTPTDRLTVIPRGVDLSRFDPDATPEDRKAALRTAWGLPDRGLKLVALLPGRLTGWKGQHILIEAAYNLKEAGQEEDFLFILAGGAQGSGSYGETLKRRIKERRVGKMVKMVGHCADMPAAIAVADVVVSTSLRPEAFGRIAVEAQAMERPVIAADHGGARETVAEDETGWLVRPDDPDALAAALSRFARLGRAARSEIGAEGRKRVAERFDKNRMCEDTLGVYERVLNAALEAGR